MTAAVLVAVIAALPAVLAQPGQMGPEPCSTEPACVEAMSCAKRREPFYWRNVFDINRCHLSMEVRVGLTVSMTGPLSRNATTEQILQTLRNLSSAKGQVDFVSIGVSFPYCLIFCVMDDESLPWKAVEHYRVFAGDSGYDSSMDVMLGPSSSDFRLAAAQVADEFQRPLVSWSLPEIMGISFVRPAQSTVRSTGAWLGNLLGSNSVIETDNVFGRLPEELLFTCRDLVVPSNYSLRTMAQFLPCDGPCDLSRDLDYCAVPRQELSITGHWDPPSVLRSGGWENGCLSFDSNGTAARLEIVMIFDTPRAMVNVDFWGGNSKTGPLLVLGSRLYSSSPPGPLVLPSGTQVMLDSSSDERIEFSICLKQDCQHFTCPAGYKRTAFGSLCNGVQCAPEDLQNCCALDQLPHVNGPFWSNSFTSVLDLAVPPKNWLDNTLPRLLHPRSQFVLCVAQSDTDGLFSDLCTSHINQAIQVGFRTLEKHLPVINADPGVHNALINLMLIRPKPSVILICSELETYSRFIHGLTAMHITFEWIVSCIPFGAQLQTKVQGSRLAWNFLEPTPWPSSLQMLHNDQEFIEAFVPTESFATLCSSKPLLTMQILALHSAVQIVNQVVHGAFILGIQEQSGDAAVALMDAGPLGQQVLANMKGTELLIETLNWGSFVTYMGTMTFDQHGRRQIQSRHEVGMRQYWPLPGINNMSDAFSVPVVYTWIYLQARHIFSMFREFDGNQVLAPYYLPVLADKSSATYPCPPGCIARQMQCFSCPPGTFRQANGSACSPCPPNNSLFQDHWASDRCFICPEGGICKSTVEPPVANTGYIRIPDFAYQETFADLIGPNACSFEAGGGLSNLRATDLSRWDEAKSRSSWIIVPCLPPEACLGSNRCAAFHTGATCSGCAPGSSKFQWYFFGLDCEECPPMALQILQISLMGIIQVVATILLSVSNKDSAWNEHSLAGPIMFSFFRTLQTHAVLSKLMIEPFPQRAFNELGPLLWICTISQVVFAPCLLPLTSCLIPLHTEGDLMAYHLLELASRLGILLLSSTLMACLARAERLDAFIRTGYTGLHFVLPSLSFYALALSQCELGYAATSATFVLAANRDMPCPAMTSNLAYLFAAVHIVAMISQWLCLPWILTKFIYRHVQDCYGMGIHKVMHGKRYWKILDDICIAVSTLFATALGEAGMTYCMFATEGSYAILTRVTQAYSFLSGNLMVHFKSQMALNILCLCSGNLFTDFLIDFFSEFLAQDLDHASMICRATILSLSLAHMLLVTSMALLENRVALVVNTRLLSAPADGWTVRLSRMVQGFGSFHSMEVHRCGSNSQLVFDARSVPQKHRKILLHGVTSTVHYILYRSTTLRLTEVRDMVNQAVEQILVARKSQVMSRLNMKGCRRSLTQEDDQAIEALLQSDLIAPHELVSTVEDMCSGDFIYRQGTKKSSTVAESEDEEPKTPNENIPHKAKKALAAATKKNSKPKHIRRRFHEAQAECARSTAKLLTEADSLNRRLGRIWMISTENSKLIPAYLDKAETLHGLLQRIHDFLGEERDARHPAVENFLDEVISQTRDWNSQVENLTRQRGAKDKDPRGVAASEAELDHELRNLFQDEAESSVTMAPDDDKSSSTAHISLRPGPERPRVKLPFNRIDFQSRTQPAPSRYPDLDWHR